MVSELKVSIPYSSGEDFNDYGAEKFDVPVRGVSIPYSSGEDFNDSPAVDLAGWMDRFQSLIHQGKISTLRMPKILQINMAKNQLSGLAMGLACAKNTSPSNARTNQSLKTAGCMICAVSVLNNKPFYRSPGRDAGGVLWSNNGF